jgi:predicted transcriptional regulator
MNEPFPEPVRLLLREHVTTFERLELLMLLFRNNEREFEQLCESLNMRRELASEALAALEAAGLVQHNGNGDAFRFSPATPALAAAVEALDIAYRDESAAVVSAMSVNAIERIRRWPPASG